MKLLEKAVRKLVSKKLARVDEKLDKLQEQTKMEQFQQDMIDLNGITRRGSL